MHETYALRLKYPLKGKITGLHDFIEFDQLYNLSLGEKCDFNVEFVANLLIHSFFTFPSFDEESNKVDGIWVTSDRQKGKALYRIPLNGILQTLRRVADDKIKEIRWTRDHTNGEWVRLSIT